MNLYVNVCITIPKKLIKASRAKHANIPYCWQCRWELLKHPEHEPTKCSHRNIIDNEDCA